MPILTQFLEGDTIAPLTGYSVLVGGAVYEDLLPDATGYPTKRLDPAIKAELTAAGLTTGWVFTRLSW